MKDYAVSAILEDKFHLKLEGQRWYSKRKSIFLKRLNMAKQKDRIVENGQFFHP